MSMFRGTTRLAGMRLAGRPMGVAPRAFAGVQGMPGVLTPARFSSHDAEETYEAFNDRYAKYFDDAEDVFDVQRGLNNAFAYDLVPSLKVVESAVRAARRVNSFATAVRIFEGIRFKVETKEQYEAYVRETADLREELGIDLKEELWKPHSSRFY